MGKADALSRLELDRFHKLDKENKMEHNPVPLPAELWPMEKVWLM